MDNGKVPDLPPVADKSNVDSYTTENPTPISNSEETEELPTVDNDTGVNTDLTGSPTEIANAEETAEDPAHDVREMYLWILETRKLLGMLQSSIVAEVGLEGTVRDSNGNLVPIASPEETLVQNEPVRTREELLECLQQNYAKLQTMAAAEARRQRTERYTASSDVQTQPGLNQPASDCSNTDGSCQTDVSKSLSNVTSKPATRNVSVHSLQCHEDEQPINDIGQDVGTSAYIFVQSPQIPLDFFKIVSEVLDAFREDQRDIGMQIFRNEGNPHVMTERPFQLSIPSTSIETQSDVSVSGTHASGSSVQLVPESSPTSSSRQSNPAKEPFQEKENS